MSRGPIVIVAGTNRRSSNASRVARILEGHYKAQELAVEVLDLIEMPRDLLDPNAYATKPVAFAPWQQAVLHAGGLHMVVPEYNGSFPGVLKLFIDMLKFPESFDKKPVAFVGESAGIWGGLRAVEQLQLVFGYRNAHTYPERVFIPGITARFDAQGQFIDQEIDARLARQVEGFGKFIQSIGSNS